MRRNEQSPKCPLCEAPVDGSGPSALARHFEVSCTAISDLPRRPE